jgi:LPXTG-motif cell wall-anchored protein
MMKKIVAFAFAIALTLVPAADSFAAGGKISPDNSSLQLAAGDTATVTLTLASPIICSGVSPTCELDLDFTSAFPAGITVTPSTVTWLSTEWSQTRTIQVSVDSGSTLAAGDYTSTAAAVSDATYYSGFVPALTVTVPEAPVDPGPIAYSSAPGLAQTGGTNQAPLTIGLIGLASVGIGVLLLRRSKR